MNYFEAIILGLVEGITEYLPVSSTGHLILTQRLLGIEQGEAADAYAICIQLGAILAVFALYRAHIKRISLGLIGRDSEGLRMGLLILLAFLPAAVSGLFLNDWIREYLFGGDKWGMWPTVAAWFFGGIAIFFFEKHRSKHNDNHPPEARLWHISWQQAFLIGCMQCLAMWPGISRSLATILGGIMVGLSLPLAVEFSFLLGLLTLGAATLHDALKYHEALLENYRLDIILVGIIVAGISAFFAVKWMVAFLTRRGLHSFGYYRIGLAIVVAILIWQKILT